jgi:hypothetical protein
MHLTQTIDVTAFQIVIALALTAAVSYLLGIYTGAYCFPVYCPPDPLSPEDRKMISDLQRVRQKLQGFKEKAEARAKAELHPNQPVSTVKEEQS